MHILSRLRYEILANQDNTSKLSDRNLASGFTIKSRIEHKGSKFTGIKELYLDKKLIKSTTIDLDNCKDIKEAKERLRNITSYNAYFINLKFSEIKDSF